MVVKVSTVAAVESAERASPCGGAYFLFTVHFI